MSNIVAVMESDLGIEFDIGVQTSNKITIKDGIFAGDGAPPTTVGSNGQFWIDTATSNIWGPMVNGVWPTGPSYFGNQGFSAFDVEQELVLGNQVYNTFCKFTTTNNVPYTIVLPSPVGVQGCYIGFWNNSTTAFTILSSTNSIIGPTKFLLGGNQPNFAFQPDDLFFIVSDGHDWVITNYVAQAPVGGVASTTAVGVAREATLTEVASGVTTGLTPAFVVPETLISALSGFPLLIAGSGAPANALGLNGWYYTDVASGVFYGPKVNNSWPAALPSPVTVTGVFGNVSGTVY